MPKQIPLTEFDMVTQPDYIQLIKAILPFMEYNMQRTVSTLIRANELKNTIQFYNSPANCNIFKTCSNSSGINFNTPITEILNNEKLINAVTTYCSGNIVNMINTYKSFSKMSDIVNMMDLFSNSSSANNTESTGNNPFGFNAGGNIFYSGGDIFNSGGNIFNAGGDSHNTENNNYNTENNRNSSNSNRAGSSTNSNGNNNLNILGNFMNSNQRDMYNEYIRKLDSLDLNHSYDDNDSDSSNNSNSEKNDSNNANSYGNN